MALGLLLLVAGCGSLPQPFFNRPGAAGLRLSQPPPSRLTVPVPAEALLPDSAAALWAGAVAEALVALEVPAVSSDRGDGLDWRLVLAAERRDGAVVPSYAVLNPAGERQGVSEGPPVALQAWAEASPATLRDVAAVGAPGVTSLLARIEAARRQSDPNSMLNRPARVAFSGVTGAPGDGNRSLPTQMRVRLAQFGMVVQDTARDADFSLSGEVRTAPGAAGAQRIEIQWVLLDAGGDERGRIVQLNEVPPGSLDRFWGDVAVVVAEEAAGGVRDVVLAQGDRPAAQGDDRPAAQGDRPAR